MEIASQSRVEAPALLPFATMTQEKPTLRQVFEAEESPLLRFAHGMVGRREMAENNPDTKPPSSRPCRRCL
jgi:hypothetical protein